MTVDHRLPEFVGFFEHVARGQLAFPRCRACTRFHWYPMPICPHCQSDDLCWQPVSGQGEIFSLTTVRHAFDPKWRDRLPYVVVLVTFDDAPGVQLIANLIASPDAHVAIGHAVVPVFPASASGEPPVCFRLADAPGPASS